MSKTVSVMLPVNAHSLNSRSWWMSFVPQRRCLEPQCYCMIDCTENCLCIFPLKEVIRKHLFITVRVYVISKQIWNIEYFMIKTLYLNWKAVASFRKRYHPLWDENILISWYIFDEKHLDTCWFNSSKCSIATKNSRVPCQGVCVTIFASFFLLSCSEIQPV